MGTKLIGILVLVLAFGSLFYLSRSGGFSPLTSLFTAPTGTPPTSSVETPPPLPPEPPPPPPALGPPSYIYPSQIPAGFTLSQLSPHFRKVRIASVSPGFRGGYARIELSAYLEEGSINITGWRLEGNRDAKVIPKAVPVYFPFGLPTEGDIILKSGDFVRIYSTSSSPLGQSVKLNKCFGYLENHYRTDPPFGARCPAIERPSVIYTFTGQCQSYIFSLGSCEESTSNPPVPLTDYGCREYLKRFNYKGCFDLHRNDADFLEREWRVWLGLNTNFLDFEHDRVLLFDRQGLLVDQYIY